MGIVRTFYAGSAFTGEQTALAMISLRHECHACHQERRNAFVKIPDKPLLLEILCLHASPDKAVAWFLWVPRLGAIAEVAGAMSPI
jgi:hypothetical protein